jgi:hypothetical protein
MANAVKIRVLTAPPAPLNSFDPGAYLGGLEFYQTDDPITEEDRNGLAQFAHFLAFLALKSKSRKWAAAVVCKESLAFRALQTHFEHLEGWEEIAGADIRYPELADFLMEHYPPQLPE